jgi:N-acetylneuraminate synthase
VAAKAIEKGVRIESDMLTIRSPGTGLSPYLRGQLIGLVTKRDMAAFDVFFPSDLTDEVPALRKYNFHRPWGLPVRHHDYKRLLEQTNPDLLEFHLSFKDLELNLDDFFGESIDFGLVVHSPEIFANDFLLDLASPVVETREQSIHELQRVVDLARGIKKFFKRAGNVPIILNAGGFTRDGFVNKVEQAVLYDRIADSLRRIDAKGVEIIPQTMPPFPWLFGGQLFHNLFLDAEGIIGFCKRTDMRVCLDVSHSKLACNHFGMSFKEFLEAVAPYTRHIHLVDARGVDGEGLQIGDGEIDFGQVAAAFDAKAPQASFIPEIWQGHKNNGEGFAIALERLEKWF